MPKPSRGAITISPGQPPAHGDTISIKAPSENGVYRLTCERDAVLLLSDGGNDEWSSVTLASQSWTEGPASCLIEARELKGGSIRTVATLEFEVAG